MGRLLLTGAIALMLMAHPASARCYVGGFRFFAGSDTDANMLTSSGKNCWFVIHASGRSQFDKSEIPVRPKHGTASLRQGVGVDYKANAGYKGDDDFVFAVTGVMRTGTGTARIKVHVTVN
jgi:hypothetical protein